ncbi:MAG: copper resistance protein NlpE N-terminal domain-containing protein [Bacteroidia bacterium]|nr:copper resistance protein NlpE N-terminal domain-containing protein [Bacteroidia bacterium]
MIKYLLSAWICSLLLLTSCERNSQQATVTVDTLESDFFESLTPTSLEFTFEGILPCADCAGIRTHLKINEDSLSYFLTETYMGRTDPDSVFLRSGTFSRITGADSVSTILELSPVKESGKLYFLVAGDSALKKLDQEGKEIISEYNYILKRK